MRKFILTAPAFTGHVVFGYDDGVLIFFHNDSNMNEKQRTWLFEKMPLAETAIKPLSGTIKGSLEEIPEDLSFNAFWEKYGKKINRKRCEPLWKKMPESKRLTCLKSIEPYKNFLLRSRFRGQLDPENYLKNESYETNWTREQ